MERLKKVNTKSGKYILKLLFDNKKITPKEDDNISVNYANDEIDAYIVFNYMSSGIHLSLNDIDLNELESDGIKIFHWAEYK